MDIFESDIFLVKDFGNNGIDEVMAIQNSISSQFVKVLNFNLQSQKWTKFWDNQSCPSYIGDWELKQDISNYFDYILVKESNLNSTISLLTFRNFGQNYCVPRFLINMYNFDEIIGHIEKVNNPD